ncbi:hypothetical protein LPB79_25145 [Rhizobium sp. T136]|uniref:hypothetical protein n=1 Tax=Rhizobium sp. T136 TaxID=555319 RepID=UPI001E63D22E|nr:hypothetical protein [Rhizobium sp. T136]UFS81561.1 hypothetical protein LPB79_25145 [Rhizobium sp. T136]
MKTRLTAVPAIKGAHNLSRLNRQFQSHNFPCALVNVDETVTLSPGSFPGEQPQTRTCKIDIQVIALDENDDPEGVLDALTVDVEKAFVRPDFGIGRISNWKLVGSGTADSAKIECGDIISQLLTYTADIWTLDAEPDRNLHA